MNSARLAQRVYRSAFLAFVLLALFQAIGADAAVPDVSINEIMAYNHSTRLDGALTNHDSADYPDWIELYNNSGSVVNLSGLILTNWGASSNATPYFRFPVYNLAPYSFLVVIYDDATNTPGEFHTGFGLEKSKGDRVALLTPDGSLEIDGVGFGKQIPDYSLSRIPNGKFGTWQLTMPSPGSYNMILATLGSPTNLVFNEWMPTNGAATHGFDDWLEVYNKSTNPVALGGVLGGTNYLGTGLVITNTFIPAGSPVPDTAVTVSNMFFIEANGFARFWCVGKRSTKPYNADELNFKLSHNTGETLVMYEGRSKTNICDMVTFFGQSTNAPFTSVWLEFTGYTTNVIYNPPYPPIQVIETNYAFYSQGRLPDGADYLMFFRHETPGESNFQPLSMLWPGLQINEILAHTDPPLQDALELYNASPTQSVNLSYYWLSNDKDDPKKFRFPANYIIPPLSYTNIYEYQFNSNWFGTNREFTFNSSRGDSVYIASASNDTSGTLTGYRKEVKFDASENGVSFGRYTNSVGDVDYAATSKLSFSSGTQVDNTFTNNIPFWSSVFIKGGGAPNPPPKLGPVVITEFMYHPPDMGTNDNTFEEYIELYNMSTNIVKLYDTNGYDGWWTNHWNLNKAVDFEFPTNTPTSPGPVIRPGEFILVVGFNPTNVLYLSHFKTQVYNIPASFTNIFGPWKGKLSNGGDTIEWRKPDARQTHGETNLVPQIMVDRIKYNDKWPWPTNRVEYDKWPWPLNSLGRIPDGGGAALQRVKPDCYGNEPTNWVSAVPSPGRLPSPLKLELPIFWSNTIILTISNVWAGTGFAIQSTTNLANPYSSTTWTKVADVLPQATTGARMVTNAVPAGTTQFYRLITPVQ